MNSSSLKRSHKLARDILDEYSRITEDFSRFQNESKLNCVSGCGKCCFKPDIYCSPIELLPLAMELLVRGQAQAFYDKSLEEENKRCLFLNVGNEENFQASCSEYKYRPLTCRTFGVYGRHEKNNEIDLFVCNLIKEHRPNEFDGYKGEIKKIPLIDLCKNRLIALDPQFLEMEYPINRSLRMILEKVLLASMYENSY